MREAIKLNAKGDHVAQWIQLKRLYVDKRGSDAGRHNKAIPRTTNDDVKQLTKWWHSQYVLELAKDDNDRSKSSRKEWLESKRKIDAYLTGANPAGVYPENEWFWQRATRRLAQYLESRKVVPGELELLFDAVEETVEERIDDVSKVANTADAVGSMIKKGLLISGGVAAALLIIPPVFRAFTAKEER